MKHSTTKYLFLTFLFIGCSIFIGNITGRNTLSLINENQQNIKREKQTSSTSTIISCIGNSITYGVGVEFRETESYPALLQKMLGKEYKVNNFGVSAKTVMNTEQAYTETESYQEALRSNPDIVIIKLGTNDSRNPFRELIPDSFVVQYNRLIDSFQNLSSNPRIILVLPVSSYLTDETKQTDKAITELVIPRIKEIAEKRNLELVDLHTPTMGKEELFPDKLHPNKEGMYIIAEELKKVIRSNY